MALTILHTGQSGVERGVDEAARAAGLPIAGVCALPAKDEFGPLPDHVLRDLTRGSERGARAAMKATLRTASVLVVIVPDRRQANSVPGIESLLRLARSLALPFFVVDPATDLEAVAVQLRELEAAQPALRVQVTGPRQTRWPGGQRVGWRVVAHLGQLDVVPADRGTANVVA